LISSILLWIVNRVAANPNPVRKLYYSSFFSSCLFFKKVSISFSNCLSASVGGTSTSFATSRNEGLPSRTISFIVIISLITPKMFIICIGSYLKDWDWDCAYSSHQKHLRLLVPPKELLFLVQNLYTATYALVCYPLWTVAFRGHGFSLLALAKGMSTLFAKNGFSRPSLKYCGVFRHVLGLRTARPIENLCSRKCFRWVE